jgi:hypothetical protein
MLQLENTLAQIVSIPYVECESPMIIAFRAKIRGEFIDTKFIGDKARALKAYIRHGAFIRLTGIIKDGILLVENCIIDRGQRVDIYT